MRTDGRQADGLRPVVISPHYQSYPEGSCLVEFGNTKVVCSAMVEDRIPPFQKGTGQGWITAEYGMLPGATNRRTAREASRGKQTGRTQEIQRLIGRSLRTITDLKGIADMTLWVDCDVIQADGGTRTAAITGAYVALVLALQKLATAGVIKTLPVRSQVAAVSVGVLGGEKLLDLKYDEDSAADVDMNVVMTDNGRMIEIQGTAEREPFSKADLDELIALAEKGMVSLFQAQREALG